MITSCAGRYACALCALVFGLYAGAIGAQKPTGATFPESITVSPGPPALKKNLFTHVMPKAEVLKALAQVNDSQDLVVKSNFAITLRAASNKTKLPWKEHVKADELWFVYRGSAKVSLAPFSLQLGITPPGTTYDVGEGDIVNVPRGMAYQIMATSGRFEYVALQKFALQRSSPTSTGGPSTTQPPPSHVTTKAEVDRAYRGWSCRYGWDSTRDQSHHFRPRQGRQLARRRCSGAVGEPRNRRAFEYRVVRNRQGCP